MKIQAQTSSVKMWFGFLRMAITQGLPINEEFYAPWGSREDLCRTTFNQWWRDRGEALFAESGPKVELIKAEDAWITLKIPTSLAAGDVKQQVSRLVTAIRGSKRIRKKTPLGFDGDVKYRTLKQYERLLEVEFDPRNAGKTIEQKTELLRDVYRRIKVRLDKQRATLQRSKKKDSKGRFISARFKARDPDGFGLSKEMRKGIDAKKVGRWRLSGQIVLLNVARGAFPGKGYYGPQLARKLRRRLDELGISEIGVSSRNTGGGQVKSRPRKASKQLEAESLKAYGSAKNQNKWGSLDG